MIPIKHISSFATGSRVICNPPVLDTDDDHFVLVEDMDMALGELLALHDFEVRGTAYGKEGGFVSIRKGDLNLVIIQDRALYLRSVAATLLAKELNLTDKEERVALFEDIQYGHVLGGSVNCEYSGPLP